MFLFQDCFYLSTLTYSQNLCTLVPIAVLLWFCKIILKLGKSIIKLVSHPRKGMTDPVIGDKSVMMRREEKEEMISGKDSNSNVLIIIIKIKWKMKIIIKIDFCEIIIPSTKFALARMCEVIHSREPKYLLAAIVTYKRSVLNISLAIAEAGIRYHDNKVTYSDERKFLLDHKHSIAKCKQRFADGISSRILINKLERIYRKRWMIG